MASSQPHPTTIVVGPSTDQVHTHTIIILHGRDSSAAEFSSEFFECEASPSKAETDNRTLPALFPTIRWVFPSALPLHSSRFGLDMSQWFDTWSTEDVLEREDLQKEGLRGGIAQILDVVMQEEKLVGGRDKIFLGGISQGFATSLATLFADGRGAFAGVFGFCGWLPFADSSVSGFIHYQPFTSTTTSTSISTSSPIPISTLTAIPAQSVHNLDRERFNLEAMQRLYLDNSGFLRSSDGNNTNHPFVDSDPNSNPDFSSTTTTTNNPNINPQSHPLLRSAC